MKRPHSPPKLRRINDEEMAALFIKRLTALDRKIRDATESERRELVPELDSLEQEIVQFLLVAALHDHEQEIIRSLLREFSQRRSN
jgi:hypothetical protein